MKSTDSAPSPTGSKFLPDERAVSFTVSYVLTVAIAVLLVGGVILAAGQTVKSQRESTVRNAATVAGDQTAATVMTVDRLVRASNESNLTNVTTVLSLPETLAGQPYRVSLNSTDGEDFVVVETDSPSIAVRTPLVVELPVQNATVVGGDIRVVYHPSTNVTLVGGKE